MYFKRFKPQDWRKRSAEARRRNCAVLPYSSRNATRAASFVHTHSEYPSKTDSSCSRASGRAGNWPSGARTIASGRAERPRPVYLSQLSFAHQRSKNAASPRERSHSASSGAKNRRASASARQGRCACRSSPTGASVNAQTQRPPLCEMLKCSSGAAGNQGFPCACRASVQSVSCGAASAAARRRIDRHIRHASSGVTAVRTACTIQREAWPWPVQVTRVRM